jgi:hypothetical protein
MQKLRAQMLLKCCDLLTDRRLTDVCLARDSGETARFYHLDEQPHRIKSVHQHFPLE